MANYTSYADIYDPEMLMRLIGVNWANEARVISSGIVSRDSLQLQGTLSTNIRQKTLQDRGRQSLKAGDTISSTGKIQSSVNSPVLWGYDSIIDPKAIEDIEVKDIDMINANRAQAIQTQITQWLDDSAIAVLEGTSGALTANQLDYSATGDIALAAINALYLKAGDKKHFLTNGGIVMQSKVENDLIGQGLLAATANTFGIQLQENMVKEGILPTNVLGLTPIVSDKLAKDGADYRSFVVGLGALIMKGGNAPDIEVHRLQDRMAARTNYDIRYALAVGGMNWGVSGKEDVSDIELATSGNWTLDTNTSSNDVPIYRLQTT